MTNDTKEFVALSIVLAFIVSGMAYCHHDKNVTERDCMKLHEPNSCR